MNKEILKQYFQNSLDAKNAMLQANSLSEEDKAMLENQVAAITDIIAKLDESDNDVTAEQLEEVKNSVNELNEKLAALNERINLNKNNDDNKEPEMENTLKNYLASAGAVTDFANAIRNSRNAEEFRKNWNEVLLANTSEDGFNFAEGTQQFYVPDFVRGKVEDLWEKGSLWLADLNNSGAKRFVVRFNSDEVAGADQRAKGWKKGVTKTSQKLNLSAKTITPQFLFKLIDLDRMTEYESDEDLLNYVLSEIVNQLLAEVRMSILVGDNREANDDFKIDSFEAIAKDTTDIFTTVLTAEADFLIDDIRKMVDEIKNEENLPVYLFLNKVDFRTLSRVAASETSTPVYLSDEQVAEMCGVARVYKTDLVGGESDYKAIAFIPKKYTLVGAGVNAIEMTTQHNIYTNVTAYRGEFPLGGAISGLKSSAVLKNA